jgi:hypothetical protein
VNSREDAVYRLQLARGYLLLAQPGVPESVRHKLNETPDDFRGLETPIRATYGDESTRTPPWLLVQESEARIGLEKGRRVVALAETIHFEIAGDAMSP